MFGVLAGACADNGRCIFLTDDDRCSIHSVSPFGCSHFSAHMEPMEGDIRSMWGLRQIMGTPAYEAARQVLAKRDGGQYEPFKAYTPTEETP
jgi:Fe-S-cluster containining protein